ncbi:hypothetical protein K437DRAFT_21271 [Tilletiaria anomala UBC 951]|uniref:Zn(2)-C6 fungal-type domain-containing protein n=1 Tax=Tilletiaria anomala (strain ATCC 24038 / CBS 436.72 / UBC 951) TaxID=1037660 RepID=A0A066VJC7_TILAU|nr:uncharacterized protein K437DRAFT_21271 [Tilletiaria anomala UBC 951]KDN38710.1 hypothetical protein K437DRAFT_21271 [Tilletiaria anomala UBC 951]
MILATGNCSIQPSTAMFRPFEKERVARGYGRPIVSDTINDSRIQGFLHCHDRDSTESSMSSSAIGASAANWRGLDQQLHHHYSESMTTSASYHPRPNYNTYLSGTAGSHEHDVYSSSVSSANNQFKPNPTHAHPYDRWQPCTVEIASQPVLQQHQLLSEGPDSSPAADAIEPMIPLSPSSDSTALSSSPVTAGLTALVPLSEFVAPEPQLSPSSSTSPGRISAEVLGGSSGSATGSSSGSVTVGFGALIVGSSVLADKFATSLLSSQEKMLHDAQVIAKLRARCEPGGETDAACDFCRKRKIKCDRVKPMCGKCQKLGRACMITDTLKKRGPPTKVEKLMLHAAGVDFQSRRIRKRERELARAHIQAFASSSDTGYDSASQPSPESESSSGRQTLGNASTSLSGTSKEPISSSTSARSRRLRQQRLVVSKEHLEPIPVSVPRSATRAYIDKISHSSYPEHQWSASGFDLAHDHCDLSPHSVPSWVSVLPPSTTCRQRTSTGSASIYDSPISVLKSLSSTFDSSASIVDSPAPQRGFIMDGVDSTMSGSIVPLPFSLLGGSTGASIDDLAATSTVATGTPQQWSRLPMFSNGSLPAEHGLPPSQGLQSPRHHQLAPVERFHAGAFQ